MAFLLATGCYDKYQTEIKVTGSTLGVACKTDLTVKGTAVFKPLVASSTFGGGVALMMWDINDGEVTVLNVEAHQKGTQSITETIDTTSFEEDHLYVFSIEAGANHDTFVKGETMTVAEYEATTTSLELYTRATSVVKVDCLP